MKDYRIFVKDKIAPVMKDGEKLYMFAHSMGGCIAALLMEEDPELFDAAVLIAPMLEILYGGLPENTAMSITRAATLMGRSEKYIMIMSIVLSAVNQDMHICMTFSCMTGITRLMAALMHGLQQLLRRLTRQ